MRFASEFDPQYMHVDEEKASEGRFNGIIASGMHTLAISFKLWVEEERYGDDVIAGTGMDNLTFIKPVYPGDTLYTKVTVMKKRKLKNNTGIITIEKVTLNRKEEKILKNELSTLMK